MKKCQLKLDDGVGPFKPLVKRLRGVKCPRLVGVSNWMEVAHNMSENTLGLPFHFSLCWDFKDNNEIVSSFGLMMEFISQNEWSLF